MTPFWPFALKSIVCGIICVVMVCGAVTLGIKHGFEAGLKDTDKTSEKEK